MGQKFLNKIKGKGGKNQSEIFHLLGKIYKKLNIRHCNGTTHELLRPFLGSVGDLDVLCRLLLGKVSTPLPSPNHHTKP